MATPISKFQRHCFWKDCPNKDNEDLILKKCSRCKTAFYCGRDCQVKDWSRHKVVCIKKRDQQQEGNPLSVIMQLANKSILHYEKYDQIMKSIENAKTNLALISKRLGSSEARLEGEKIFKDAQEFLNKMLDPDCSKIDILDPRTFSGPISIEEGFRQLESFKDKAENLVKEYSMKKLPSLDNLSDAEKEELLFKTIDENIAQIETVSDRIVFLISNGCGIIDGKFSERIKQKIELITNSSVRFEIETEILIKSGAFS